MSFLPPASATFNPFFAPSLIFAAAPPCAAPASTTAENILTYQHRHVKNYLRC